jgi:ParB family chromosome partitioning protein
MEVDRIVPDPDQPRKEFSDEALDRLALSLQKHGQLMPIRVRWDVGLGKWVIISGERRYRAALRAGLRTVACIFADKGLTPEEVLQEQLIENLLREDLKPVEQARAYRQLMTVHSWTAKELSAELHVSQGAISKALALLDMPEDLQELVDAGAIPATAAYEVARVEDEGVRREIADRIVAGELTRDEASKAVRRAAGGKAGAKGRGGAKGKARRPTARVLRTSDGYRITAEHRRGVDAESLLVALEEATAMLRAEVGAGGRDAA